MRDGFHKIRHVAASASGGRRLYNRWRYGADAPRPHQSFDIAPHDITDRYWVSKNAGQIIGWWQSGQIVAGDWDHARRDITKARKYKACVTRFRDGGTWEDSGIINYMMQRIAKEGPVDQCATRADVDARYARLDALWETTKTTGHLPHRPTGALEGILAHDGILVHVDRDGQLLFGNQGFHRLAIAKLANLDRLRVSLGLVHPDALPLKTLLG